MKNENLKREESHTIDGNDELKKTESLECKSYILSVFHLLLPIPIQNYLNLFKMAGFSLLQISCVLVFRHLN